MSPHAKAGGLADVIGSLPAGLAANGARVCVVLPAYKTLLQKLKTERVAGDFAVEVGARSYSFTLFTAMGAGGLPIYLIGNEGFFGRDGIYGEGGRDYADNLQRFVFFGRAAATVLAEIIKPDVIHSHDWHASVLPIVIRADPRLREKFARTVSVFTIHNLAFQGIFDAGEFPLLNLDWSYFSIDCLEFYGRVNLMKGAVVLSDAVTTVSPTYAREVTTDPELGFGLDGVLRAKGDRFVGILNGADYNEWNPATDDYVAARYSPADPKGKRLCNRDLRDRIKLPEENGEPLVGMVSRMTPQKGFDLLARCLDEVLNLKLQLAILGSGDPEMEERFRDAEHRHPKSLRVVIGFDNAVAHKIQAGCDMFLMPSRFEPCGLTQMYALKYGTIPVVRATGGLADTIVEFDSKSGVGNGFAFKGYNQDELIAAMRRAVETYAKPELWRRLQENAFGADFSWDRAAQNYLALFQRLGAHAQ
jgi:starch synthase